MKITLPTEPFKTLLGKLANPPGEEPVHIGTLAVVITASEFDGITLRRTTANANIVAGAEGSVEAEGECAVGYSKLADVVKGCRAADIVFEHAEGTLQIKSGKREASVVCFNPGDVLPATVAAETVAELDLLSTDLDGQLATVLPAVGTNDAQPHLTGVCLRSQRGRATLFAVDGRRFHLRFGAASKAVFNPHEGKDAGAMLTTATASALRRLISGPESKVGLSVADGAITARCGQICATLPLGAASPPYVDAILPWDKAPNEMATCNRAELLQAVRDAAPLGFQDDKVITIKFTPGAVIVIADNEQGVQVRDPIDAVTTCKKGEQIYRVKAQWFGEMLDQTPGETLELEYNAPPRVGAPMLCTRAEDRLLCVLLTRDHLSAKA